MNKKYVLLEKDGMSDDMCLFYARKIDVYEETPGFFVPVINADAYETEFTYIEYGNAIEFCIKVWKWSDSKIETVKAMKMVTNLDLRQSKTICDTYIFKQ